MIQPQPNQYSDTGEASQIVGRLLASLPAASFEMETFARLAGIVMTRKIPTAAMECQLRPRLLINPDFVAKYCKRDEHLFLLVMHELWHVLLAHTSLYSRITQIQNIAFDAVINAGLSRQFNKPAYRGFFEELNPPDKFPHLLLRPPVGWPENPQYPSDIGPVGTQRILRQLYPKHRFFAPRAPFYKEILDLIKQDMRERGMLVDGMPVLLGDHESDGEASDTDNPYLKDMIERLSENWPALPPGLKKPGKGSATREQQIDLWAASYEARRAFAEVLRRCLGQNHGLVRKRHRVPIPGISGTSVLPNGRDRLIHARRQLGTQGTIWSQPNDVKARIQEKHRRAHVYIDVSGSMSKLIPNLLGLILPYVAHGKADIFQFSTVVEPLPLSQLRKGMLRTTGGTSILCVMKHILEMTPPVRNVLILTDGFTGRPRQDHIQQFAANNIRVHVVLPAEKGNERHLSSIATSITVLPPMG